MTGAMRYLELKWTLKELHSTMKTKIQPYAALSEIGTFELQHLHFVAVV